MKQDSKICRVLPNSVTAAMHRLGCENIWDLARICGESPLDVYRALSPSCINVLAFGTTDEIDCWLGIVNSLQLSASDLCAVLRG